MREIKFRYYEKSTGKLIYSEKGWFRSVFKHNNGFMQDMRISSIIDRHHEGFGFVEQFTGLTDKNGVEIYEGSKMKIKLPMGGFWGDTKREEIGVVRYESDYGSFIVQWEYSKHQHHEILGCDIAIEGEVIGNIHDNGQD